MLLSLTIRDFVLIERLDLTFSPGLSVLTGETGAGKSILLDALGLAVGARAEASLVRPGAAAQAVISAAFEVPTDSPLRALLAEQGIEAEDTLVLRRVVGADGRSRGFVNDQPASVGLLRQIGAVLVEIQGQFEQHGLMDSSTHRSLLDAYAEAAGAVASVRTGWSRWRDADHAATAADRALAQARADEDWLRHALAELDAAAPGQDNEAGLAERRAVLMHRGQVIEAASSASAEIAGHRGALHALNAAARLLERVRDKAGGRLDEAVAAVERSLIEAQEAANLLDAACRDSGDEPDRLDEIEERLFALRALARKHNVAVDALAALQIDVAARLAALDSGDEELKRLRRIERAAHSEFVAACTALTRVRRGAADRLAHEVAAELPALKLERARFLVSVTALPETELGPQGADRVAFEVAANPGAAPGPLGRIASGGELSRFLLALKLVLAKVSAIPTIVFDEVDSGIGGAVAAAVGERLDRLGRELQVLVVTHSPQVAARGAHHWRVVKDVRGDTTTTEIESLGAPERREEIARMLAGAHVTAEARAAAERLLAGGAP